MPPRTATRSPGRSATLVALALLAFAANSLLCRAALGAGLIGPTAFTAVRLASGALALLSLTRLRSGRPGGSWLQATMLFGYATAFSFAYLELPAGTGALILFGFVQATMIARGLQRGERLGVAECAGVLLAGGGLVWLLLPGLGAPAPRGAVLMATAGICWGAYTLLGRGSRDGIADTAGNFVRAVPLIALAALALPRDTASATPRGLTLAIVSGALTSGAGYAVWYAILPSLTATRAALLQLVVPVLAAAAGVALLGEPLTARLVAAAVLVPGGIALAIVGRR